MEELVLHPTMVRLQLAFAIALCSLSPISPSHYGSTATIVADSGLDSLEPSPSHYGSTATKEVVRVAFDLTPSPSHYGSTATGKNRVAGSPMNPFSIPLWFDCNRLEPVICKKDKR